MITINTVNFEISTVEKDVVQFRDFTGNAESLTFKRQAPKRTKDFPGMEKSESKYVISDPILGVIAIATVNTSIRADQPDSVRNRVIAAVQGVGAISEFDDLVLDQRLKFS